MRPPNCICALPTSAGFLLWSMRQWCLEAREWEERGSMPADGSLLQRGFTTAGFERALPDFAMALDVLLSGRRSGMHIHSPRCSAISHDESQLLALFALAQEERHEPLLVSLNSMMDPIEALAAAMSMRSVGLALAEKGLRLPAPTRDAGASLN